MTGLEYIRGVTTIKLNPTKCDGCRMCIKVCPHAVFGFSSRTVEVLKPDHCMECGACVINCPEGALAVAPGVGCAVAILKGWISRSEPCC